MEISFEQKQLDAVVNRMCRLEMRVKQLQRDLDERFGANKRARASIGFSPSTVSPEDDGENKEQTA
jgi:uncharacterized protein (UPF0335 family)